MRNRFSGRETHFDAFGGSQIVDWETSVPPETHFLIGCVEAVRRENGAERRVSVVSLVPPLTRLTASPTFKINNGITGSIFGQEQFGQVRLLLRLKPIFPTF